MKKTTVTINLTENLPPSKRLLQTSREDWGEDASHIWSEEASHILIEAWGDRYLALKHGNLRQQHWQEVADTVNHRFNAVSKAPRTEVQCRNRIDTLKKKYKLEKAKILDSNGTLSTTWPFYDRLHTLIAISAPSSSRKPSQFLALSPPSSSPLASNDILNRGKFRVSSDDLYFRRNHSGEGVVDSERTKSRSSSESKRRGGEVEGFREMVKAITRVGEIYERVEGEKHVKMVELEKQRMEFIKSLEFDRMQLFMDTQVQLEKIKRARRAVASDNYC